MLQLVVHLLFGLLCSSIDLLGGSVDIPFDLLLDLFCLLCELFFPFEIVESFLMPSAASKLLGDLIDGSLDVLLSRLALGESLGRWGSLGWLVDLALQALQLVL